MIDITDIKTILGGAIGNTLLWALNVNDLQVWSNIFWHSCVSVATIYFLYRNHKKKK